MNQLNKVFLVFALSLLLISLLFGVVSILAFINADYFKDIFPFQQVRPFHVSAALFWIITGAAGGILIYAEESYPGLQKHRKLLQAFMIIWMLTIIAIFISYAFGLYGGREYWEFPPILNLFLLIAWVLLLFSFFRSVLLINDDKPVYVWMWMTGILFFFFTFVEQNLWHIPWFRLNFLKEMTIQWKSNGSMVGAWNQMIYGTALYLMVKMSGDEQIAKSWKAYFSYFLGLTNLIFNWGHHIYNVPSASWIRDVSYAISMTEWVLVISIIQGFKHKLEEQKKFKHLLTYRFLIAAEAWVFFNLLLALLMSIPAINRYTHGTHVTVAHAMGTTIGINTMILLASFSYLLKADVQAKIKKPFLFGWGYWISQASLLVFWLALIIAGIVKGMQLVNQPTAFFTDVMTPVYPYLKLFMIAGFVLSVGLLVIIIYLFRLFKQKP